MQPRRYMQYAKNNRRINNTQNMDIESRGLSFAFLVTGKGP